MERVIHTNLPLGELIMEAASEEEVVDPMARAFRSYNKVSNE